MAADAADDAADGGRAENGRREDGRERRASGGAPPGAVAGGRLVLVSWTLPLASLVITAAS
jgi:hypothetical protein